MNFVYAIDKNYNQQAYISINSLNENINEEISILIIHQDPVSFDGYREQLVNLKNIKNIEVAKFKSDWINFPELEEAHVSEATYYRLFIDEYIDQKVDFYIYLDADVICVNNPLYELSKSIKKMVALDIPIAARTESVLIRNKNTVDNLHMFEKLKMKSGSYFNAGVMIINHNKFIKNDIYSELRSHLEENVANIKYWDQDVLNSYFDGKYVELIEQLNFKMLLTSVTFPNSHLDANVLLMHYQGSWKPWSIRGALNVNSSFYQNYYYSLGLGKYHIENTWRLGGLFNLLKGVLNFKVFKLDRTFSFLVSSLKSLLKK